MQTYNIQIRVDVNYQQVECSGNTPCLLADQIRDLVQNYFKDTCKTCGFYENNCPFIRGKLIPYPNKVCKDYFKEEDGHE